LLSSVLQLVVLIHVIKLNIKIKMVKSVKFHVISGVVSYKSGLIYKILIVKITWLTFELVTWKRHWPCFI
jgi:hypothetical protein